MVAMTAKARLLGLRAGWYENNAHCEWELFCVDPAQHVLLTFSSFSTEANFDFVRTAEQCGGGGGLAGSGTPAEHSYDGSGPPLGAGLGLCSPATVTFTSDGSVSGAGFEASFVCE